MTCATTPSDEDLLRLIVAGHEDAFAELYHRRQRAIYRFALQMSGSPAIAEDVTQEVFIALIRDGARFDASKGSLAAYLFGIARNHVLRRLDQDRSFTQMPERSDSDDSNTPAAMIAEADPLGELARNEMARSLRSAILTLPAHYREVVVLCDLQEMSYVEAAAVVGCATGTVRSRLHRARVLLLEKLRSSRESNAASEQEPARCFA